MKYTSREQKQTIFKNCIYLDSESDVRAFLDLVGKGTFDSGNTFRGAKKASYVLYTSFQREWIEWGMEGVLNHHALIRYFLLEAHRLRETEVATIPELKQVEAYDDLGMLSLLQHYGCPTPLLDFTTDIRVALLFAAEPSSSTDLQSPLDDYFSIYTFSNYLIELVNRGLEATWKEHSTDERESARRFVRSYDAMSVQDVLVYHPDRHNEVYGMGVVPFWNSKKIQAQKGAFGSNVSSNMGFAEALLAHVYRRTRVQRLRNGAHDWIRCLNIHRQFAPVVIDWLREQQPSIDRHSLFLDEPERTLLKELPHTAYRHLFAWWLTQRGPRAWLKKKGIAVAKIKSPFTTDEGNMNELLNLFRGL